MGLATDMLSWPVSLASKEAFEALVLSVPSPCSCGAVVGGLTAAVRAHEADPLAGLHLPRRVLEHLLCPVVQRCGGGGHVAMGRDRKEEREGGNWPRKGIRHRELKHILKKKKIRNHKNTLKH